MILENWLYADLLNTRTDFCEPLKKNIKCDTLVVGGGMAGLHAALRLINNKKDVVLLEKSICGGSSSGKSAGFLTPSTESDLSNLIDYYGTDQAKFLYNIPKIGINLIISTAKKYKFNCDLQKQDSLYLAVSKSHAEYIKEEAQAYRKLGFPFTFYDAKKIRSIHPGKGYFGGLSYSGTYGINSLVYVQELKNLLVKKGVRVYEGSEVHNITGNKAKTHLGSVKANNIIVCIDKMTTEFDRDFSKKYYHIQSYLAISEPLSKTEIKDVFPKKKFMCWDTRHIYTHYRMMGNDRLLIGGGSFLTTYYPKYYNSPFVINMVINDFKKRFSTLKDVKFSQYWNGLIDVTKDLTPIVDFDPKNKNVQYVLGCPGLPFAAFCGDYAAKRILNTHQKEYAKHLRYDREFFISDTLQMILGKPVSFLISHIHALTHPGLKK